MKKIPSLFKRDYEGSRQVYDEVVEGSEWVLCGEGRATIKWDGTSCMIKDGVLWKRYDRKLTKAAGRKKRKNKDFVPSIDDFKPAPATWQPAEPEPNKHTGHWPGWVKVDFESSQDKYHAEAFAHLTITSTWGFDGMQIDGFYELVGPKIQGNPHDFDHHVFVEHGTNNFAEDPPRDFDGLSEWFSQHIYEGIVWHHPDGRMVKIKRKDFGYKWPG